MKRYLIIIFSITLFSPIMSMAHCEIPCGIYGDEMRFDMINEHISTIEKSMNMIQSLSAEKEINYNQLVRWINNKEDHAEQIQEIVSQYFLTQRVKPVDKTDKIKFENYQKQLESCHQLLILAMKAKQSTDIDIVHKLEATLADFRLAYLVPEKEKHSH